MIISERLGFHLYETIIYLVNISCFDRYRTPWVCHHTPNAGYWMFIWMKFQYFIRQVSYLRLFDTPKLVALPDKIRRYTHMLSSPASTTYLFDFVCSDWHHLPEYVVSPYLQHRVSNVYLADSAIVTRCQTRCIGYHTRENLIPQTQKLVHYQPRVRDVPTCFHLPISVTYLFDFFISDWHHASSWVCHITIRPKLVSS